MSEALSITFACIVNHTLGGRVVVEAGHKGSLDRQITGFVSGVVNKRADQQGTFNQGDLAFSYMKGSTPTYSFVVVSPTKVDVEVIWAFLRDLSSQAQGKEDKAVLTELVTKLLEEYKSVDTKEKLQAIQAKKTASTSSSSPVAGPAQTSPFSIFHNFFASVVEKTTTRDPNVDPFSHFISSVEQSYNEQGGTESVMRTLSTVTETTRQKIEKVEADIAQQGVANYFNAGLEEAQKGALELGGTILDHATKIDTEAQKSGGYGELIKKELSVLEENLAPVTTQVGTALAQGSAEAATVIGAGIEKINQDVESKGGVGAFLAAESENALAVSIQVGTVLANNASTFGQDVQTKGFQSAVTESIDNLSKQLSKKEPSTNSGFDEESF